MTATFLIPEFSPALETVSIFVDGVEFDTVAGLVTEYYSEDIPTNAVIEVGAEENKVTVRTFERDLLTRIRVVCQVLESDVSDEDILILFKVAKRDLMLEICQYKYGEEIRLIKDNYYALPNKFFFDLNCGGIVSILDFEAFKQTLPIYAFTAKEPVNIIAMNARDGWIQLDTRLSGNEVMKINYYYTQREAKYDDIITLLSWRIAAEYYTQQYNTYVTGSTSDQVKVGDITVRRANGETTSIGFLVDRINKANAQFNKYLTYFKKGFYRVK